MSLRKSEGDPPQVPSAKSSPLASNDIVNDPCDEDHDLYGLELISAQGRAARLFLGLPEFRSSDRAQLRATLSVDRAIAVCGCRHCVAPAESLGIPNDRQSVAAATDSEAA